MAVGAGGAITDGENGLGLPGSRRGAFSVGSTGAADVVVVVVVVVVSVVSLGASSLLEHDAVSTTIAVTAAPPAMAATRRPKTDLMFTVLTVPTSASFTKIKPAFETLAERRESRLMNAVWQSRSAGDRSLRFGKGR